MPLSALPYGETVFITWPSGFYITIERFLIYVQSGVYEKNARKARALRA